ncbi:ParM/StbA family protein [Cupriavidus necator]|uniref:ParM/StbA family protein n=1 Tax=Cupriavidus necator TaxID=106590 RepID=UPI0005B5610C|nr:ParM/StbA family protein [Cupriavidus necator]
MASNQFNDVGGGVHPVGVDDGHFGIKVVAGPGRSFVMPARAWAGKLLTAQFHDSQAPDNVYETADGEFVTITASDVAAPAVDTRSADYPTSSVNRALVAHALIEAGAAGHQVSIVTGLPVDRFYLRGSKNVELIEAKKSSLLRPLARPAGAEGLAPLATVVDHAVISEAVAAFLDAQLDFDGNEDPEFSEISEVMPVAVVDVGGKTTDIAVVREGGAGLYSEKSGTAEVGALYLYDQLDRRLREAFQLKEEVPFAYRKRAIETGTYMLYGKKHDVSEMVSDALDDFAVQVGHEVSKRLKDASIFGRTLFVGGGARLLASRRAQVFPGVPAEGIWIPDEPEFANARGMYKAAYASLFQR